MNFSVLRYLPCETLEGLGIEKLYELDGKSFHAFPERWYGILPYGGVVDDMDSQMKVFNPLEFPKEEVGIGNGLMRFGVVAESIH